MITMTNNSDDMPSLRFKMGDRVQCNCGSWQTGTIVKLFYTQRNFPAGECAPYQIKLDDGRLIYSPTDEDRVIRLDTSTVAHATGIAMQAPAEKPRGRSERKVMLEISMRLASSRSFDSATALYCSAPFMQGTAYELDHALANEVVSKLSICDAASLACTSSSMAALTAGNIDSDVEALLDAFRKAFDARLPEVEKRLNSSMSQQLYALADDYDDLPDSYRIHYEQQIGKLIRHHASCKQLKPGSPVQSAAMLGVIAASIDGSCEALGRAAGWGEGVDNVWYEELFPDVMEYYREVKRLGLPPAVIACARDRMCNCSAFEDYFARGFDEEEEDW